MNIKEVKEIQGLAKEVKETGKGWEELFDKMAVVTKSTASRHYKKFSAVNIDYADIISEVNYAVVKAVESFDFSNDNVDFIQYYTVIVKRDLNTLYRKAAAEKRKAMTDYTSLYTTYGDDDSLSLIDIIADNISIEDSYCITDTLKEAIKTLSESDQEIVRLLIAANGSRSELRGMLEAKFPEIGRDGRNTKVIRARRRLKTALNKLA